MEYIQQIFDTCNDYLWSYIMVAFLLLSALFYTLRTRFVQFRLIGDMLRLVTGSEKGAEPGSTERKPEAAGKERNISSMAAFFISMGSRVGGGNLVGVAVAIVLGGPGAVFWMWITALLGSATAFVECTLAQIYKERGKDSFIGGAAYYIEHGLGKRKLSVVYSVLFLITFGLFFTTAQSNTISYAIQWMTGIDTATIGIVLALCLFVVCFGGIQRIAKVCNIMVPLMALGYLVLTVVVIGMNIEKLPDMFGMIFRSAFGMDQVVGGGVGAAIMYGVRRGLFSNDAGIGSIPMLAAAAKVSHPVKQGLMQSLGVLIDTIVICSCTAAIILLSGASLDGSTAGIKLVQKALDMEIGQLSVIFITIAIFFFCFSSMLAYCIYGENSIRHFRGGRRMVVAFRLILPLASFVGSVASLELVWTIADLGMAAVTFINLFALVLLYPQTTKALKDYIRQKKAGKNPTFDYPFINGDTPSKQ